MLKKVLALAVLAVLGTTLVGADKPGKATVEVVSMSIYKKVDPKINTFSNDSITVGLVVQDSSRQFISVDAGGKVKEFKDDKGTDLTKIAFGTANFSGGGVGTGRNSLTFWINGAPRPAKGATKLTIKGDLVVLCGTDEKTTAEADVEIKKGKEVKVDDFTLKVTADKFFGTFGGSFDIASKKNNIKSVSFKDADGKTVEMTTYGPHGFGTNWTMQCTLKKEASKGKVTVTYFSKEEKVTIPVEVTTGLDLQ